MHQRSLNIRDQILCGLFTAMIAVGAFIRIPVPLIPFTLQFLFTMLAGIMLGGKRGAISVVCYILLGLAGFPVFAEGGGIAYCWAISAFYLGQAIGLRALFLFVFYSPSPATSSFVSLPRSWENVSSPLSEHKSRSKR